MRKHLLWLFVAVILGWWFFAGESPVTVAKNFIGRGHKLTTSHLNADGSLQESIDDIQAQLSAAVGRQVSRTAAICARVVASESPGGTDKEKVAIIHVLLNDAAAHGWSLDYTVTVNPGTLGSQAGRRYSTAGGGKLGSREVHEDDLFWAEAIEGGAYGDVTGGASKFIHWTGAKSFADWLAGHPKVQEWVSAGTKPIDLGGVGCLIVFVKSSEVADNGQPKNAAPWEG